MESKYKVGDRVYNNGTKATVKEVLVESPGHVQYVLKNDSGALCVVYESHEGLLSSKQQKSPRIQPLYCFVKLNKALVYLSSVCQWGDKKHGKGPIKHNVDYTAKIQSHLTRFLSGEQFDRESGIDHRIAIAFNCLAQVQVEKESMDVEELVTASLSYFTKELP